MLPTEFRCIQRLQISGYFFEDVELLTRLIFNSHRF
jgi:hypothetical protein